jgi:hypothetical protein
LLSLLTPNNISGSIEFRGLCGMRVDFCEVEFSGDQKEHGAHGRKAHEAAGLAFGRLEQAVDGFDKPIGLARLRPKSVAYCRSENAFHLLLSEKTYKSSLTPYIACAVANNPGKRQDPPSIDEGISRGPWGRTRQAQHRS